METMDDLGIFIGIVGPGFLNEDRDEQVRDSVHFCGMHGDGRMFIKSKEKDFGMRRLDTGRVVRLIIDLDRHVHEIVLRGGASSQEVPGIPASCCLAVCFGGKAQRIRITNCTHSGITD